MAIDSKGQVTTTGLMGGSPKMPPAPDMSALQAQQPPQQVQEQAQTASKEQVPDQNIEKRLQSLTKIEIAQLDGVLSPTNAAIFKKIAPEASSVIDQFTSSEEVVSLPVSAVVNYAKKIYGADEKAAVQQFITELSGEQPDNTTNVPPENMQASNPSSIMAQEPDTSETDAIDQGLV